MATEAGFFIGRRKRKDGGLEKFPIENSASGIVLGLLAFILAFSFGSVASRYKELKEIARNDTDAIEDLYQMADFLPESDASQTRRLLHEYHRIRLDAIETRNLAELTPAIERSQEIHEELWTIAVRVRMADDNSILNQFVSMTNVLMDTHNNRIHKGLNTRMPSAIWWMTGGLLFLSSMLLGLSSGIHGKRSLMASAIVIFCFSAVIAMIVDLDRPFRTLFNRDADPVATGLLERMDAEAGK
ncbi:hypothetical protein [Haloferula sp.]|uniref:bestrophin-like domain n=1 Tax=Haloferula sp. TaxID=2497595 RepID=UPI00329F7532